MKGCLASTVISVRVLVCEKPAISPSSLCYTETINTLLYAQRAKNIVNKPIVNEDPVARLICELRAEIHRLQSLLLSQVVFVVPPPSDARVLCFWVVCPSVCPACIPEVCECEIF